MYRTVALALFASVALACPAADAAAAAPISAYGQCGGQNWNQGTTCVSGYTCTYQNAYYSQCVPGSSGGSGGQGSSPPASSSKPATVPTSTHTSQPATSPTTAPSSGNGQALKASFTHYGAGDSFGSPNCNTNTAACGFFTSPGFSAAASQNLFGVGPGAGAGPACGTCWKLTGQTDSSGNKLSNAGTSIVVMVNNLCPAQGNPLCAQNGLTGTNQYGANVNFDLCSDSGASAAFFGNSGVGLALGTAVQVSCSQYSGTVVH